MNTDLQIFTNEQFGSIRAVEVDGEPWFIAKDVCESFGDMNHIRSVGRIDDSDKRSVPIVDNLGRTQTATAVNESGLYSLLFSMQPQKANNGGVSDAYPIEVQDRIANLRNFKRWVTHDIIPSIRKHGGYLTPDKIEEALLNPDVLIRLATELKTAQEQRKALEAQNSILLPKADFYDAIIESTDTIEMATVAKILNVGIGRNRLFEILREQKVLRYDNTPLQHFVDLAWFKCVESKYTKPDGGTFINVKTVVYQKGIDGILKLLKEKYGLVPKIVA